MPKTTQLIADYNAYRATDKNPNKLIEGLSKEIELSEIEYISEAISGAGIAGEIEVILEGYTGPLEIEIPFNNRNEDYHALLNGGKIIIRVAYQVEDKSTGEIDYENETITIRGRAKGATLGKIGTGVVGEANIKWSVNHIKIVRENKTVFELDKLNRICIVDGVDKLAKIRNAI